MGFNSSVAIGPFGDVAVDVTSFGAKGDGIADDRAAIQAAIDGTPAGSRILFPRGTFLISAPLNITKEVRLCGAYEKDGGVSGGGSEIKCSSSFVGSQMIRNWTAADFAGGNDGFRPNTTASPVYRAAIEKLLLDSNGKALTAFIEWVHLQDTGYMRDLAMVSSGGTTGVSGIRLFSNSDSQGNLIGGQLSSIITYGTGWKHELYVSANFGSSLHVQDWVTTTGLHSDSPFYIEKISHVELEFIQNSAWLDSSVPGDAAQYRFVNVKGITIRGSIHGLGANCPRPYLKATNTLGGNGISSPILDGIQFDLGAFTFTGNLIEDTTQTSRTVTLAAPVRILRYDGQMIAYYSGDGSTLKYEFFAPLTIDDTATFPAGAPGAPKLVVGAAGYGLVKNGSQLQIDAAAATQASFEEPTNGNVSAALRANRSSVVTVDQVSFGVADSGGAGFRLLRIPN